MGCHDNANGGGGIDPRRTIIVLLSLLALILIGNGLLMVLPEDIVTKIHAYFLGSR